MRRKPPEFPDPAVKRIVSHFHRRFRERFEFKPNPRHFARLAYDIKALLSGWDEATMIDLVDDFFSTTDPRVQRSDYTGTAFAGLAQYLRVRGSGRTIRDERTAVNFDVVARATGR
jgi:hypothetical protein